MRLEMFPVVTVESRRCSLLGKWWKEFQAQLKAHSRFKSWMCFYNSKLTQEYQVVQYHWLGEMKSTERWGAGLREKREHSWRMGWNWFQEWMSRRTAVWWGVNGEIVPVLQGFRKKRKFCKFCLSHIRMQGTLAYISLWVIYKFPKNSLSILLDGVQFGDNRRIIFSKLGMLPWFSVTFLELLSVFWSFHYVS